MKEIKVSIKLAILAMVLATGVSGCVKSENKESQTDSASTYNEMIVEYQDVVNYYNYEVNRVVRGKRKTSVNLDSLRKECRTLEAKIHKVRPELTPEENKQYRKIQRTFFRHDDMLKAERGQ